MSVEGVGVGSGLVEGVGVVFGEGLDGVEGWAVGCFAAAEALASGSLAKMGLGGGWVNFAIKYRDAKVAPPISRAMASTKPIRNLTQPDKFMGNLSALAIAIVAGCDC